MIFQKLSQIKHFSINNQPAVIFFIMIPNLLNCYFPQFNFILFLLLTLIIKFIELSFWEFNPFSNKSSKHDTLSQRISTKSILAMKNPRYFTNGIEAFYYLIIFV